MQNDTTIKSLDIGSLPFMLLHIQVKKHNILYKDTSKIWIGHDVAKKLNFHIGLFTDIYSLARNAALQSKANYYITSRITYHDCIMYHKHLS